MSKELPKNYDANEFEDNIYKYWEDSGFFKPEIDPKKESYTISMPPPNATGTLHLGHAVMLAIEDILTRYHRMQGKSALWIPGTDHASIATQNKVERIIEEEGTNRHELGREEFLKRVNEFVANSQNTIRGQIRKMGASCDWSRERYTLDAGLSEAVQVQFIKMYEDGLIYRGYRIVNWCPRCSSTLADDEVENKDIQAKFYYIKYGPFTVATSRPETKLADTAVAVNPEDKRYKDHIGKEYDIDLAGHKIHIKVIADEEVDMEFGTGALGVTPAHSMVDYDMAQKNDLEVIKLINEEGKINENGGKYEGLTVLECREKFVEDLRATGQVEKVEDYTQPLSVCYRCGHNVEPLPSKQWFIDVNKKVEDYSPLVPRTNPDLKVEGKSLKDLALEVVRNKDINIIPERFEKTYFHWMENLRDWCISRQIWFGHRIPVWYCKNCTTENAEENSLKGIVVQKDKPEKCPDCNGTDFIQDPDTLDTWFSSGLWTFSTLGWPEKTEDLEYFHPTACLETGYDILFFWIARMILMTTYAMQEVPFKNVYLHGLVRTRDGAKMSKSHPETCIDPLDVIKKYGADAVRLSLIIGTTPGNDVRLYEEKIKGFRNFVTKIWNIARFTLMNVEDLHADKNIDPNTFSLADKWIISRLQDLISKSTDNLESYQLGETGQMIYDFMWHDFADWYLEVSKQNMNEPVVVYTLKTLLKLLHPYAPFVTEKLWTELEEKDLILSPWPKVNEDYMYPAEEQEFSLIQGVVTVIRNLRSSANIAPNKEIKAILHGADSTETLKKDSETIKTLCNLSELEITEHGEKIENALSSVVRGVAVYIPLEGAIDAEAEKKRLEKEISNLENYLSVLDKKLSNESFVKNAPEQVVAEEKEKQSEAQEKVDKLKQSLSSL